MIGSNDLLGPKAIVVQWQNMAFPSLRRGFDFPGPATARSATADSPTPIFNYPNKTRLRWAFYVFQKPK